MSANKPLPKLLLALPLLLGAALVLLYWRGMTLNPNQTPSRLLGKPLPSVRLPSLLDRSEQLDTAQIKGPALINIWATWCSACRSEHALLQKITRDYGIPIYGIDYQDDRDSALAWLSQKGNPFAKVLFDGAAAAGLPLDIGNLPQTYLIDSKGMVRYRYIGELTPQLWLEISTLDDIRPALGL